MSLETRRRRPARISPSAHLARIRRARDSGVVECWLWRFRCGVTWAGGVSRTVICRRMCVASVTRRSSFRGEWGARSATKTKERNFHHAAGEFGLLTASSISVESESATKGRAALGIRAITLVPALRLARPAAIPRAGTFDIWVAGSDTESCLPRHFRQCHTERARAWAIVSLTHEVCHLWPQRMQVTAAFLELRLLHA